MHHTEVSQAVQHPVEEEAVQRVEPGVEAHAPGIPGLAMISNANLLPSKGHDRPPGKGSATTGSCVLSLHTHMHTHTHTCTRPHTPHIYIHMHTHTYHTLIHTHTSIRAHPHPHAHLPHIHTHTHAHIHMHTHTGLDSSDDDDDEVGETEAARLIELES